LIKISAHLLHVCPAETILLDKTTLHSNTKTFTFNMLDNPKNNNPEIPFCREFMLWLRLNADFHENLLYLVCKKLQPDEKFYTGARVKA